MNGTIGVLAGNFMRPQEFEDIDFSKIEDEDQKASLIEAHFENASAELKRRTKQLGVANETLAHLRSAMDTMHESEIVFSDSMDRIADAVGRLTAIQSSLSFQAIKAQRILDRISQVKQEQTT